jgi:hypothetical protein
MDYSDVKRSVIEWLKGPPVKTEDIRSVVRHGFAGSLLLAIDDALEAAMGRNEAAVVGYLKKIDKRLAQLAKLLGKQPPATSYAGRAQYWRMITPDALTIAEVVLSESKRLRKRMRQAINKMCEAIQAMCERVMIVRPPTTLATSPEWDSKTRQATFTFDVKCILMHTVRFFEDLNGSKQPIPPTDQIISRLVDMMMTSIAPQIDAIAADFSKNVRSETAKLTRESRSRIQRSAQEMLTARFREELNNAFTVGEHDVRINAETAVGDGYPVARGTRIRQMVMAVGLVALHAATALTGIPFALSRSAEFMALLVAGLPPILIALSLPILLKFHTLASKKKLQRDAVTKLYQDARLVLERQLRIAFERVEASISYGWLEGVLKAAALETALRPLQVLGIEYPHWVQERRRRQELDGMSQPERNTAQQSYESD